jgi:hypothetical protein
VPEDRCWNEPVENCWEELEQKCWDEPGQECWDEPVTVTDMTSKEECTTKVVKQCSKVKIKACH